jgi:hypothetical protein
MSKPSFPLIPLGVYCHTKSGKLYDVLGVALQTETEEPLVIYRPLYESEFELFARPFDMFLERVEINGISEPRFKKTED